MSESVKVIVRARPLNSRETGMGCKIVTTMDGARGQCSIANPGEPNGPPKTFTFDGAYNIDSVTESIYNEICYPLVENCLEGYNGTVFAYGQTGSGKSFSMQGPDGIAPQKGIIPRTFEHIFESTATTENTKFLVYSSYLEIYKEEVRDLLNVQPNGAQAVKMEIKEHPEKGVYVAGLSMHAVHNTQECGQLMDKGLKSRHTGATLMNQDSSRSHSIFTINMEMMNLKEDGEEHIRSAKLHLVDLAGSERQAKTGATGVRLKEATKINLSLSALGNVISALVDGKSSHIPYRDSKLTRLLQDSLGGNTKTIMIACLSPADNNYDETLSTLRYANRAKNIQNKPKINEDPKDALLRQYQEEIEKLKNMIQTGGIVEKPVDSNKLEAERAKIKEEYEREMAKMKDKYQNEKKSNSKLQEEMSKLKSSYDKQMSKVSGGAAGEEGISADEAAQRLQMLQEQLVGGEQASNSKLKEKRTKKMKEAEKKRAKLADALSRVEGDDPLLKVYDSVNEKLEAMTKQYNREKEKSRALKTEINDIQSEFELDRIDYLDTIRRQDQQLKLATQILEKVQPSIRRDSNYSNIDKVKKDAVWDEDSQRWILPDMIVAKTQLPAAGGGGVMPGGRAGLAPMNNNQHAYSDNEDEKLRQRLQQSESDNIASNYFKPQRSDRIMQNAERDKKRADTDLSRSSFPSKGINWNNLSKGIIFTQDIYEGSNNNKSKAAAFGESKPARLDALGTIQPVNKQRRIRPI